MVKAPKTSSSDTKVTRIKASDSSKRTPKVKPAIDTKKHQADEKATKRETKSRRNPLRALAGYFKGSWDELIQVRWPDRKTTWGMTGALIAFTVFFVLVVLACDYLFSQLFKLILGSN